MKKRIMLFILLLLQIEGKCQNKAMIHEYDSCHNIYYKEKINFIECYLKSKCILRSEIDSNGNKVCIQIKINDSLTSVINFNNNGSLLNTFTKCTKTGAEIGIFTSYFPNGKIHEQGAFIPNTCNCKTFNINSYEEKNGLGYLIFKSTKSGPWIEFDDKGNFIKSIFFDFPNCP